MDAIAVVVLEIVLEDSSQMYRAEDDYVVKVFSPDAAV